MNHSKIQEILEHDTKFGPLVANRDTRILTRNGGEVCYARLTVQVLEAIEHSGMEEKTCNRAVVLAFATRASKGNPTFIPAPLLPSIKKTESSDTIIVRPAQLDGGKGMSEKAQQRVQQVDLAGFVARGDILKFQGSVAIGQLLAAIFQLAEGDCYDGHERRKELLNELLESYEAVSKRHVNLSVKQIIRAKTEEQLRGS